MPQLGASAQVTLLDNAKFFVFSLEDASSPGVSIESIQPPKPYGNPIQETFLFNCISGHVYTIKVWESVDATPTGVVRCGYSVTATTNSVMVRLPIYAEVDTTPGWVAGSDTVADLSYIGWTISKLTRNPDYLVFNDEPDNTKNDAVRNSDGFTLSGGITFGHLEQWCVEFAPQIVAAQPGTPSSPFGTGRIITANETLTNADKNKALILQSALNKLTVTLPALSTLTDFTDIIYFMSNGGSHINAILPTQGSDKIQYLGTVDRVVLGQGEFVGLFKAFTYYWPLCDLPGIRMVGELLYNLGNDEPNTILCDGSELQRDEYPRLWAWVQSTAPAVSQATWDAFTTHNGNTYYPNRGKFSTGNGSTTFRLPVLTNALLRGVDGSTRLPGTFQTDQVGQHDITIPLVQHTTAGSFGVTDGPLGSPITKSFTQLVGQKNIMENTGAYLLIRI